MRHVIWAVALLLVLVNRTHVRGETVIIPASADNTLYEDFGGTTSNGAGQYLFAGLNAVEFRRRGLIRFDVAAALPAGAVIQSVSLTLHLSRTITGTEEVSLHRALAGWGEGASVGLGEEGAGAPAEPGDATWLHRIWDTTLWASQGGDFDAAPSASSFVVGPEFYSWSSQAMVADVTQWLDQPAMNSGWVIIGNETAAFTAKRFDSRNHNDAAVRPSLSVTYVPGPGAAVLCAASLLLGRRRGRFSA